MSAIPLSVKHRPRNLEDIIGQEVAIKSIKHAFEHKSLHHAYIFAGKFGCGKTTMARVLAAMFNCRKGPTSVPCNECDNCIAIFQGKALDVKEIDAASNRGIDDIRALKEEVRYSPIEGQKKIVIIDEAHSLTDKAAEAALKIIEEPPPHVIFILCTTDPHMIIETIHSRCLTLKFYKVNWSQIHQHLIKVAEKEQTIIDDDALKLCARSAGGSVRNALQNLQSLINYKGDKDITFDDAKLVLGAIDENLYFKMVTSLIDTNAPQGFQVIEQILSDGRDAAQALDGLYAHLRKLLLAKTCPKDLSSFGFTEEDAKRFSYQSSQSGLELIMEMMSLTMDVSRGLNFNLDPQTLFEKLFVDSVIAKRRIDAKKKR